jgi:hypothetical protein
MSCGSSINSKISAVCRRDFSAGGGWSWLSRIANKIQSTIYAASRRQVIIEIEKLRLRGLLTDRDVIFLASLGLTHLRNRGDKMKSKLSGS